MSDYLYAHLLRLLRLEVVRTGWHGGVQPTHPVPLRLLLLLWRRSRALRLRPLLLLLPRLTGGDGLGKQPAQLRPP